MVYESFQEVFQEEVSATRDAHHGFSTHILYVSKYSLPADYGLAH